jgi:putative hemin transport protein
METPTTTSDTLATEIQSYIDKREAFKADNPKARARTIADGIGLSEAEFVSLDLGNRSHEDRVVRLKEAWTDILAEIESLGDVMALTRNEACVHEKVGRGSYCLVCGRKN